MSAQKAKPPEEFFLPYQKKWILDNSRIKLMEKSRQIGLSWCCAYAMVRRHCTQVNGTKLLDSWVSSRDELQAKLFMDDCRKFAAAICSASMLKYNFSPASANSDGAGTLAFADGGRIVSLSSNPDAQAGKRGCRLLDEFALHPDPRKLYAIALPGITWGGNLEIVSTHRGADNFFNELVEEARHGGNPKGISLHRVTLQDALEQGLLRKIKAALPPDNPLLDLDEAAYFDQVRNSCPDEDSFMQEYMCQPLDSSSRFIPAEMLEKCLYKDGENWRTNLDDNIRSADKQYYMGVDVGRTSDLSVFWILERLGDTLYTRRIEEFKNTPFSEQEAVLYSYLENPNLRRVCIDQTGLGRQFAERAAQRFGGVRVEAISFTPASKESLAYPLRSAFEDCRIRIPNIPAVRADIGAVKRSSSFSGLVRFEAERTSYGHADRFWALALANFAAKESLRDTKVELVKNMVW